MVNGNLPDGWAWATVGDVVTRMSNGISEKQTKDGEGLPVTRIETISQGVIDMERVGYLQNLSPEIVEKYRLQKGDILFSHINSDTHLGKTAIFEKDHLALLHGMNLLRLQVDTNIVSPRFFHYFCNHYRFSGYFISIAQHAVNQSSINQKKLNQVPFPLPSLPEQKRIVAKIEELFTQLEAGAAALKRVRAGLKRYKASVLKAAVEGRLFVGADGVRPMKETGVRLLSEEASPAQAGRTPSARTEGELSDGWKWATVGELTQKMQYGTSEKADSDDVGIPVLRMGNIQNGELDFGNLKYLPENIKGLNEIMLEPGDMLFNRTNSAELVGKTAIYREHHPRATLASYLIRVKLRLDIVLPDFVSFYINSFYGRKYISSVVSQQVGQANVNGTKLANMPIPLPPLAEQRRIVAEVERRLSVAQEVESVVAASVARAGRLRQSVLKSAFEGRLTP